MNNKFDNLLYDDEEDYKTRKVEANQFFGLWLATIIGVIFTVYSIGRDLKILHLQKLQLLPFAKMAF